MSKNPYHQLPVAEKERYARDRVREPPMRCPACETSVQPEDLLKHQAERCPGRPAPHPHGKWLSFRQALQLGADRRLLSRWVQGGRVRIDGPRGGRRYLLRDVADQMARSRSRNVNRAPKPLTNPQRRDHVGRMAETLTEEARERLRALAEPLGSIDALARKMDLSTDTLRRAIRGEPVRKVTRKTIETQMEKL